MQKDNIETENLKEKGSSSRVRKVLIHDAIQLLIDEQKDYNNRYVVLEKLAEILCLRYKTPKGNKGKYKDNGDNNDNDYENGNLDYHTKRMGMDTTSKMLIAIDEYFYKDYEKDFKG